MKSNATLAATCLGLVLAAAPLSAGAAEAMTNADVEALTEAGLGAGVIVAKIEASETAFDTSVPALVALARSGVADEVVAAMVAATAAGVTVADVPAAGRSAPGRQPAAGAETRSDARVREPRAMPGTTFRDALRSGGEGPQMVVVPAGRFRMGCLSNDDDCGHGEDPVREVSIAAPFALSAREVTFEDYDRFTYPNKVDDRLWGRGRRPVIMVSWDDAKAYAAWLSAETGAAYRLPSEAEWEYAARAGARTKYSWGDEVGRNRANCDGCGSQWDRRQTAPAGSFAPNGFGLYDMHGNVSEWVEDCWNRSYAGAPSNGGAWLSGDCGERVLRGGSWFDIPRFLRTAYRLSYTTDSRDFHLGFRVARTLTP